MTITGYMKGYALTTAEAKANAPRVVAFINDVEAQLPGLLRVSSTVRDKEHNERVGGVENSLHLVERAGAVDFVPKNGVFSDTLKNALYKICQKHGMGLKDHDVKTGRHYHCEIRKPGKK